MALSRRLSLKQFAFRRERALYIRYLIAILLKHPEGLLFPCLGLLPAWWAQDSWSYMVALACKGKCPHELGRSCIIFYDSASEITQHHFCWRGRRSLAQTGAEANSRRVLRFLCGRAIGMRDGTTAVFREENVTSHMAYT